MKLETTYLWECIYKMEGSVFVARSYYDLVKQMRAVPFDQPTTNKEHRETTKRVFWEWDNTTLDDTDDKTFVRSLIDCGYVRILSANRKPVKTKENN